MTEKEYSLLFHNAPDLFFSVCPNNGKILTCNQTALNILSYDKKDLLKKTFFDLFDQSSKKRLQKYFTYYQKKSSLINLELVIKKKDDTKIDVCLNTSFALSIACLVGV